VRIGYCRRSELVEAGSGHGVGTKRREFSPVFCNQSTGPQAAATLNPMTV
jgi:hypothetical protein